MGVDEGCGQMLLARVDIQGERKEARTGGHSWVVGGGVWEKACQRGEREFWEAATKCEVLVAQRWHGCCISIQVPGMSECVPEG